MDIVDIKGGVWCHGASNAHDENCEYFLKATTLCFEYKRW